MTVWALAKLRCTVPVAFLVQLQQRVELVGCSGSDLETLEQGGTPLASLFYQANSENYIALMLCLYRWISV